VPNPNVTIRFLLRRWKVVLPPMPGSVLGALTEQLSDRLYTTRQVTHLELLYTRRFKFKPKLSKNNRNNTETLTYKRALIETRIGF
jgi:hypothetical protein